MSVPNKYFYIGFGEYKKVYSSKKIDKCTICESSSGFIKQKPSKLRSKMGQDLIRCRTCRSLIVVQRENPPEVKFISDQDQEKYWTHMENKKKLNSILTIDK